MEKEVRSVKNDIAQLDKELLENIRVKHQKLSEIDDEKALISQTQRQSRQEIKAKKSKLLFMQRAVEDLESEILDSKDQYEQD